MWNEMLIKLKPIKKGYENGMKIGKEVEIMMIRVLWWGAWLAVDNIGN